MKLLATLAILFLATAPALAGSTLYTFNVTSGSILMNFHGQGTTQGTMGGTFAATIFQGDGHVGASDTFILENSGLTNTTALKLGLAGLATANIGVGKICFLDFAPVSSAHIPGSGVPGTVNTDVYVEASINVTGLINTPFTTKVWANSALPFSVAFTTSVGASGVINTSLVGTFSYSILMPQIDPTATIDFVLSLQGTAHAVPDPTLGGLTALGLAGAGAWLRRRR